MDFEKLKEFITLAKNENVAELTYKNGEEKYHVILLGKGGHLVSHNSDYSNQELNKYPGNKIEMPGDKKNEKSSFEILSPFVGTFYAQPSPDSVPYVKIGDSIAVGQVLCIIEAMKIMNEIESDVSGTVVEVCVENENYVEYGQVLFKIKP
jgi:acetyl-CoA carboxylase biotin carboxyl carrier protein